MENGGLAIPVNGTPSTQVLKPDTWQATQAAIDTLKAALTVQPKDVLIFAE